MTDSERKIAVRIGNDEDAPRLCVLAAKLFHQAYVGSMSTDNLDSYIAEKFGVIQQRAELLDTNITTLLVEVENVLVGFAQLRLEPIPVAKGFDISAELWRIYVDRSCHGLGVGRQLLSRLGDVAREMSHDQIWLGVWGKNTKAIAFYKKLGFNEIGVREFRVGAEMQNDLVFIGSTSAF